MAGVKKWKDDPFTCRKCFPSGFPALSVFLRNWFLDFFDANPLSKLNLRNSTHCSVSLTYWIWVYCMHRTELNFDK